MTADRDVAAWWIEKMKAQLQGRPMAPEFGDEPPGVRHLRLLPDDELDG